MSIIKKIGFKYIFRLILIIILTFLIVLGICFYNMQPIIITYAESNAETIMLNSANEAIVQILDENNVTYDDIVNLTTNQDGYVISLETDVYQVNKFKSCISNKISEIIAQKEHYGMSIPIGSFLGNTYLTGFGPKIRFKMQMTTTAFVDFTHEFKSAGINQVLHIININVEIRGSLIVAGYNKTISVSTTAIAAQTVIVGKTPDAFTNVIESEKDNTGGLINDYGAIAQ